MIRSEVAVTNRLGLHSRAANRFVRLASRFESEISVANAAGFTVNGKSILGLLALAAAQGTLLRLAADGQDARNAVDALSDLVHTGFGEDAG